MRAAAWGIIYIYVYIYESSGMGHYIYMRAAWINYSICQINIPSADLISWFARLGYFWHGACSHACSHAALIQPRAFPCCSHAWCFHAAPMVLPCCSHDASMLLPWCTPHATPVLLPCCFHATPTTPPCRFHAASMPLPPLPHAASIIIGIQANMCGAFGKLKAIIKSVLGPLKIKEFLNWDIGVIGGCSAWFLVKI